MVASIALYDSKIRKNSGLRKRLSLDATEGLREGLCNKQRGLEGPGSPGDSGGRKVREVRAVQEGIWGVS